MNGAQALLKTLVDAGVEVCFSNPGTSEMHFVAALDTAPGMHGVLCLFEGVATGAADGYGRMADRPAAVLLHLGPGLANGLANLHNARRAKTPIVNIVGDHATYHQRYDAPLESDIAALAGSVSGWLRRTARGEDVAADAAEAVAAALAAPGRIATLVLPADVSWTDMNGAVTADDVSNAGGAAPAATAAPLTVRPPAPVHDSVIESAAGLLLGGEPCVLMIGGDATRRDGLEAADRIAAATGARLLCETFPARLERGAGIPAVDRLAYLAEMAAFQLDGTKHLILAGAGRPVSFFAYPGKPSDLVPEGCQVHVLAEGAEDATGALARLAELVAKDTEPRPAAAARPDLPAGPLTAETAAAVIGALLPEDAIVSDESNTSGLWLAGATAGAPAHDWLTLTGGAIGQGMPLAVGAAIACPSRPVICLESDGSAMYTVSALWTMAREELDITTILFNNGSYAILNMELQRVGAAPPLNGTDGESGQGESGEGESGEGKSGEGKSGEGDGGDGKVSAAREMFDLSRPALDFVAMSQGMGVPASRARTTEELAEQFRRAIAERGPHLIEVVVPPVA